MLWVALVLAVSIAIALVRGGKLSNLGEIHLDLWKLLPLGIALQLTAALLPDDRSWSRGVGVSLILASLLLLMVVVLANHNEVGLWIAALGLAMNFTVIAVNRGMPVMPEAAVIAGAESTDLVLDAKHVILDSDSRLVFLADVIPIPFLRQVVSMGDVFLAIGVGMFVEDQLRQPLRWFRRIGESEPGSAARR